MNNNITLTDFLARVNSLEVTAEKKELNMSSWLQEDECSIRFFFSTSERGSLTYVFKEQVSFGCNAKTRKPERSLADILGLLDKAEAFLASYTTPIGHLQEEIEKLESELAAKREALAESKKILISKEDNNK